MNTPRFRFRLRNPDDERVYLGRGEAGSRQAPSGAVLHWPLSCRRPSAVAEKASVEDLIVKSGPLIKALGSCKMLVLTFPHWHATGVVRVALWRA